MSGLILALAMGAASASAPVVLAADGRRASLASTVALFWRPDCGPCLTELNDLSQLRRAAAPLSVAPVALPGAPGPSTAVALRRMGLPPAATLRMQGDAQEILVRYGGAPARLPLAVAFDVAGRPCGRRTGFLGYDHLRQWARSCGSADARRP